MRAKSLYGRCREVVRGLDLPHPFTSQELCARIASQRGRPLDLLPLPTPTVPGTPSGMWLMTEDKDYVFYDSETSLPHREHIVLHEIGHMLCGHDQGEVDTQLYRHIKVTDPDSVRRLPRVHYTNRQEQEAELVASLILASIGRLPAPSPFTGVLANMESALGFHRTH